MGETLKPCPFCGGECRIVKTSWGYCPQCQGRDDDGIWCHLHVLPLPSYNTPEEAAEAWNRRAERTSAIEVSHGSHGPEPRFPGDVWTMHHVCSACGGAVDAGDSYCKHCGARFEREEG